MSIEILPPEILERILLSYCTTSKDVVHFSLTCKRLYDVSQSGEVWREIFSRELKALYENLQSKDKTSIDWKREYEKYVLTRREVDLIITQLSPKFYHKSELSFSDFKEFDNILLQKNPETDFTHLYILHSIRSKLCDGNNHSDLTYKYYGQKVVAHVQHRLLTSDVQQFMKDTETAKYDLESYVIYEKVLMMIASWCQPEQQISQLYVTNELDSLANEIFHILVQKEIIDGSSLKNVEDLRKTAKSPDLEAAILDATNQFLEMEGFDGNKDNYYLAENSYINCILETKRGIPISLSLLYLCLAGRLGVILEPVNFPRHFLLRWRQHPLKSGGSQFAYIDVFRKGVRMKESETGDLLPPVGIRLEPDYFQVASPLQTAQRMLRNLIAIGSSSSFTSRDSNFTLLRSTLELMLMVNKETEMSDLGFMLIRIYLQLNINHEEVERMCCEYRNVPGISDQVEYLNSHCQNQKQSLQESDNEIIPKKRKIEDFTYGNVRFTVGNVAKHKKYNYTCVVYGWDEKCTASKSWIHQMRVDQLPRKETQPFYNVLVMDGSNRYAADENLESCDPVTISHPEIGKYFKGFSFETGYIPNQELITEYPDDSQ